MTAQRIDGGHVAREIQQKIREQVQARVALGLRPPGLAVILVGDDPASQVYVGHKQRACEAVGIRSDVFRLPKDTSQNALQKLIQECNQNTAVDGILLQLPLPAPLNADDLLEIIHPDKDVDGFHPYNLGRLAQYRPRLQPCTPKGIVTLLRYYSIPLAGKHAVVVGASAIVGRPMALQLLMNHCTVTICHRHTQDLAAQVRQADILVVAIGNPQVIQSDWIKPGAVVLDVGTNRLANGQLVGDIDFESASKRASWITPVPGGVGPMTVASLLENTLLAATGF